MGYERSCNTRNESPPHARGFQASLKTFGQPREPAHRHRHCEVLSLDVARRNMVAVGIATDNSRPWFHALSWRISRWRIFVRASPRLMIRWRANLLF